MNKQNKEKAVEISYHYLQQVDCFKKTRYDEDDILSTARDATMEMAAWKEQQMIEKVYILLVEKYFFTEDEAKKFIEDFKKAMEE